MKLQALFKTWKYCLGLFAVSAAWAASAFTPPFTNCEIKKDVEQGSYWVFSKNPDQLTAGIGIVPREMIDQVSVTVKDGRLVVDTTKLYEGSKAGKSVTIRFYGPDISSLAKLEKGKKNSSETNRLEFDVQAVPAGIEASLFFEGGMLDDNAKPAHYWQAEKALFTGAGQKVAIERTLPNSIQSLWARFDIGSAGVFSFTSVTMKKIAVKQANVDPTFNFIRNGGAELGWDNTMQIDLKYKQMAHSGKHIDFRNQEIKVDSTYAIDDKTFHSGRRSFLVESPAANANFDFRFNPVPHFAGRPVYYAFWAKAEKPTAIDMSLHIMSGSACGKIAFVGTEWTKCELFIPAWGDNHGDCYIIGSMAGSDSRHVSPGITFRDQPGKVWIDDVVYLIGQGAEFNDPSTVWVRGELDNDMHCYLTGAPVNAALEFEAAKNAVDAEVSYQITGITGKTVFQSPVLKKLHLTPGNIARETFRITLPETLRGPFNLSFAVKSANGKIDYKHFYLGVVDPAPAKGSTRVGLEIPSEQDIRLVIPYLKLFGVGTARIGGASGDQGRAFQLLPYLQKAGITALFTTGLSHEQRKDKNLYNAYWDMMEKNIKQFKGMVMAYETQNEANIDNFSIEENLEQIKTLTALVRKHDPQAKIAGPTPCSTDFTWIDNVLRKGGAECLDIITEHPYRTLPELPDCYDDGIALRKLIDMYKKGAPHFGTESGRQHLPAFPGNLIGDYELLISLRDVRNIIQGIAGGMETYYHFAIETWAVSSAWNSLFLGNMGNRRTPIPNPVLYGIRTFVDHVGDAPAVERVKLGLNYRCHIFAGRDKRTAVMWKWQGAPSVMTLSNTDAAKVKIFDFGGSRLSGGTIELNEAPVYLESALSASELAELIRRSPIGGSDGQSIALAPAITGDSSFALEVRNITGQPVSAVVTVATPGVVKENAARELKDIGPESSSPAMFTTLAPIDTRDRMIDFTVATSGTKTVSRYSVNLRGIIAHKVKKPLVIDGELSDWPANTRVIQLDARDANDKTKSWDAAADSVKAELRYAWDDDALYTAVTVYKKDFFPMTTADHPDSMWMFDSIQTCFDTLRNGDPAKDQFDDDDFEYALGILAGKPAVFRRWASSAVHDSLPKNQGLVDEVRFAIKQHPGKVVYEAAFSKRSVSPFKLRSGSLMRTCTIVNLNNGKERIGYLQLTPGVGDSKTPGKWMDIILLP